jgi:hypothetical protein
VTLTDESTCEPGTTCSFAFTDTDTGDHFDVTGVLLGYASSRRTRHTHPGADAPPNGRGCQACRWLEVTIIRHAGYYIVAYVGRSIIDGEANRVTVHSTQSAHTVIEVLTQTRDDTMFIPRTSRIALSEAAGRDEGIERAWIDRAVS